MSTDRKVAGALLALTTLALGASGWALEPSPEAKAEAAKTKAEEPGKPPESTPSQVPDAQQQPPGETQPASTQSAEDAEKERQAAEQAKAKQRAEAEAAADAEEARANAKAPKRFIPSTRSTADKSVTFPVDI